MMGEQTGAQEALFYGFSIEGHVPSDHMLRSIDRFVVLLIMAPSTQELEPPTIPGRFTIPGALFMKQAPANASFKVDWILEQRNREDQSTKALMDSLINDIRTKGIKIGHSTGTGFGWFEMINDKIDNKEVRDAA